MSSEIIAVLERIKHAVESKGTLYLNQPRLQVLKLGRFPSGTPYEGMIGQALLRTVHNSVKYPEAAYSGFTRAFSEVVSRRTEYTIVALPGLFGRLISMVRDAPMSTWGQATLPGFADVADAVFSRIRPLTGALARELRIAALCLAVETDDEHAILFRELAVGLSIMQRRADGRLPANETIVLATD